MKYLLLLCFQIFAITAFSQNSPTVIGGTVSNSEVEISFSLGEVVVQNAIQTETLIHSGVIQPFTNVSVPVKEISTYNLNIFPNPTGAQLNIEQDESLFTEYHIYSVDGKLLLQGFFENQIKGLGELPSGVYLLSLRNENQIYNSLFEKI